MNLMQCQTCGASDFTNGKCDYCRNQYEVNEDKIFYGNSKEDDSSLTFTELDEDITFQETPAGKLILKIMIYTLVSIVWFAVTVFIPPLFIITIILLVVYGTFRLTIKKK
ncbi:membrane protein [Lactococcus phage GL7]|nr:membrane protein [Lactococcus phage GL7]